MLLLRLKQQKTSAKWILFLDELPWLASKRSGLLQALDYYWNRYWSALCNLIVIVCGSAASWILENLINAKGGLHNRLTRRILLKPYTLKGSKEFLNHYNIQLNDKQLCDLYMVFGGVPYYLKQIQRGKSSAQNINAICFRREGFLYGEFDRLFTSLFDHSENHISIIRNIGKQSKGITREELVKKIKISSGGTLSKYLDELEAAGFIQSYVPYGLKKNIFYRVIDEYVLFYLHWIDPLKGKGIETAKSYWEMKTKSPSSLAWSGNAFEAICLKHTDQIRSALGLDSISCEMGSWRYVPKKGKKEEGAQIDLLLDREDGIVTICEIKYADKPFVIDKAYAKQLATKIEVFETHFQTKKQIHLAMITISGIKHTIWSDELINNELKIDDLLQ